MDKIPQNQQLLFTDIRQLIDDARLKVSKVIASSVTALYWNIGTRINKEMLNNQRAEYGQQIVATLSRQLVQEYGSNFEEKNLRRIIQFAQLFSDAEIVATLWRQLSWSHFKLLIPLYPGFYSVFSEDSIRGTVSHDLKTDEIAYFRTLWTKIRSIKTSS